jgi:hypothetical protein
VRTLACLFFFAASLVLAAGCSRGKGEPKDEQQKQETPPVETPKEPDPEPKVEPEPEPEPAPGQLVNLKLPRDGGAWPWSVGTTPEAPEGRPVSYTGAGLYAANGIAVRPEASRAVVTLRFDPTGNKKLDPKKSDFTRVLLIDLAAGTTMKEWLVPGQHMVLDVSADGRSMLVTHPESGKDRCTLRLWVIGPDWELKRWSALAHTMPKEGLRDDAAVTAGLQVRWAAFVGERIVSMSRAGQLAVFDNEGLKPLATMDGTPCRPGVTPDGSKVAFLVGPMIALLDPQSRKIVGARWVGIAPQHPVLRFSPDGKKLAIGGNQRAMILNLASGEMQNLMMPRLDVNDNGVFDKTFEWAGPAHLLADNVLFDPQLPNPVWEYRSIEEIQVRGGRAWVSSRIPGSPTAMLRSVVLPGPGVEGAIAAEKAKPGTFALHPGSGVKIDVAGIPADRRDDTRAVLERRVREIGFNPDANAPSTLFASVDSPGTKPTVTFSGYGSYTYTKKPARIRLVHDGKELWNDAWAIEPPFTLEMKSGAGLTDYLNRQAIGHPDYRAFAIAPLPSHHPGPNTPTGPLGRTDLAPGR